MQNSITINMSDYELPECEKVSMVFDRLTKINAAVTQNGLKEVYSEVHDVYEQSYGIGF